MSHRYPRNHFTKILHRIFSRLDKCSIAEVEWFEYIIRRERQSSSIEVKKIWVFGSYARGALNCGDLDLIVEIAGGRQPPRSSVFRVFFRSAPDVHIYLGTPQKNGSGLEVTDSILIWDGKILDWMSAIAGIRDNPEATHFSRAIDRLPFRAEQLQAYSDTLEEIVEAEKQGIIKWAMSALPEPIPENRLDEFGKRFARQFHDAGKKTRQIGHHIFAYMHHAKTGLVLTRHVKEIA